MEYMLRYIAVILAALWAFSCLVLKASGMIHILLIVSIIVTLLQLFTPQEEENEK